MVDEDDDDYRFGDLGDDANPQFDGIANLIELVIQLMILVVVLWAFYQILMSLLPML